MPCRIAASEPIADQRCSQALTLLLRPSAHEREVPMWICGLHFTHRSDDCERAGLRVLARDRSHRPVEGLRLLIAHVPSGREPQAHSSKVVENEGSVAIDRFFDE